MVQEFWTSLTFERESWVLLWVMGVERAESLTPHIINSPQTAGGNTESHSKKTFITDTSSCNFHPDLSIGSFDLWGHLSVDNWLN